jgi:phosphotransferase family enzyme
VPLSKQASPEQIVEKVHPAVQAWLRLRPGSSEPGGITLLKNTPRSTVCRIEGVGPGGSGIVAKRCPRADGELEAFIYSEVLDRLSMESVRCYGFIEEGAGEHGWLFLEDGGITQVAGKGESFPIAFAPWLALLHGSASNLPIRGRLPERGPTWYLEILRAARLGLCQSLPERNWGDLDRSAAERMLVCFEVLERNWYLVEERCNGLPWTLVHCDLQPKNILIRHTACGIAFLPLDWEEAGWGAPAPDLPGIDAVSYWSIARRTWAGIELRRVEEQVCCGALFQILSAVGWEMIRLAAGSEEKAMRRLRIYAPRLTASTKALGLEV